MTRVEGTAIPIEPFRAAQLSTPITSPARLTRGPPELPGLTEASVWMNSKPGGPPSGGGPFQLTMPSETALRRPYG